MKIILFLLIMVFTPACTSNPKNTETVLTYDMHVIPPQNKDGGVRHVILNDGTSNKPESETNVWGLHREIHKQKIKLGKKDDIHLFYDEGVGYSGFITGFSGLVMGHGLKRNILQGYEHLSENYDDERGDVIYLFGFSRGAYQVRVLANILNTLGIVKAPPGMTYDEKQNLFNDVYKTAQLEKPPRKDGQAERIAKFKDDHPDLEIIPNVEVEVLGVWDTVASVQLPKTRRDPEIYTKDGDLSAKLGGNVKNAFHALSLDERRRNYLPVLFCEESLKKAMQKEKIDPMAIYGCYINDDDNFKEVWFPGDHTAIGGGKNSELKDTTWYLEGFPRVKREKVKNPNEVRKIAFEWMLKQIKQEELVVDKYKYLNEEEYNNLVHMDYKLTADGVFFKVFPKTTRDIYLPCGSTLHQSVLDKMKKPIKKKDGEKYYYRPDALLTRISLNRNKKEYPWGLGDECFNIEKKLKNNTEDALK